ncbi:TonB-dependent receptor [Tenacibaculum maritimum]|uniref:TonB-dependent outer membrane receptor n=1 Tax=Tenacibaculum maritimum NCIMB 2154 TaxID=1349785 RepID=A0A2H1EDA1_9FLAO|nr:TonB-dependent receptor [Tenacibaculum maritimum]SFZ85045.1 TonB-dependent outer membrane receptor [Tenacibaculum maritimum NCIMB 2154]
MNNKILIICIAIILPIMSYSQQIYTGKIIDQNNNPVVGAAIISLENKNKGTTTDLHGSFSITLTTPSVQISSIGFNTKTITLLKKKNLISLEETIESLEEIIVSASREIQKRKEIPAAIGVLSSTQIKETKAFGIEQLVNQIPGVFMSTSKAASNEQHFMATRSPISTKSLFLYIEDGLPIRPVAVFNHNALLEMNSTAFNRVEVLKGPASSIYGSEAIGGSFNFITKNPSKELSGSLGLQINSLGLTRQEADISTTVNEKYGFYFGGHHIARKNGPVAHSNYEKTALTFKNVNDFSENLKWINTVTFIDYRSDMSGSISEKNYLDGDYKSNQTFTEREAKSIRFRSSLNKIWNDHHKTSFNFIYRNNEMNQIPSYRIKQHRENGKLTGTGTGEINSNKFTSYVGLIQHKIDFNFASASLITGATADFSPQDYIAEKIDVTVNTNNAQNIAYSLKKDADILNYDADIFNYAGYAQFEISPLESLKFTSAIRYDGFSYDYNNRIEDIAGVKDTKVTYHNIAPKLGLNYNINRNSGIYVNYSKGFTPPQTASLFRNSKNKMAGNTVFDLNPAKFNNYEIGGYFSVPSKLKLDIALYQLDGKDRLISIRDANGNFAQKNAGKTRSRGIELGIKYNFLEHLSFSYSGSYATHRYTRFFHRNIDYSNTDMQTAPNYLANASLTYKPIQNLNISLEHEQIGKYNTSFENQAIIGKDTNGNSIKGTSTYKGHHVFNLRITYRIKKLEVWMHALNIFDQLYAVRASYSPWSKQNSYSIGNPKAFHLGVKYNF